MTRYLVVDLEGTCCDDGSIPPDERETIEIGAVIVDSVGWESESTFERFVRPVRHPLLTPFCISLTGIKQSDIGLGPNTFDVVWQEFCVWRIGCGPHEFCSWGGYDREQFQRDCDYWRIVINMEDHINLASLFQKKYKSRRGHRGAMKRLGLTPEGAHHRGLADALNIAKMLPFLMTE